MSDNTTLKSNSTLALGSYNEISIFVLPVSALLVRLCNIYYTDHVVDLACGTGNIAITLRRTSAKITGIDITPEIGSSKSGSIFSRGR
jgi:2-polyprenyl-3-methyl-5-hydroxy-6-metoxy-1,4-benzoquinol methylase